MLISFQLIGSQINWSLPPTQISSTMQTASEPKIALDGMGNTITAWVEAGTVKAKAKLFGIGWGTTATISGVGSSHVSLVCDANGRSTAVWLQNGVVTAATKTLNGVWSSTAMLSNSGSSNPTLGMDAAGNVIAAWAQNGNIQTSTKLAGGTWQPRVQISSTGADLSHIAIGGSGANTQATIVWHAANNSVYGATKLLSANNWGTTQLLSGTSLANFPHVAVDGNGNTTAVWFNYQVAGANYYNVSVQAASLPFQGKWVNFSTLSSPGLTNPANLFLSVKYDQLGNAIALWNTSFDQAHFNIQSAILPSSQSWSSPINLVTNNLYSYNAHLSVSAFGDALALYMFYNGANVLMQSSELDITGFMDSIWSLPLNLSQENENASPYLASSINGNVMNTAAVWIESSSLNSVMASLGSKTLVAAPTNVGAARGANNFGPFTEYYNTLTWDSSNGPDVMGYLIYRNGVFIAEVDADTTSFIDHNQGQTTPVVYGIATLDTQESHSLIVSAAL